MSAKAKSARKRNLFRGVALSVGARSEASSLDSAVSFISQMFTACALTSGWPLWLKLQEFLCIVAKLLCLKNVSTFQLAFLSRQHTLFVHQPHTSSMGLVLSIIINHVKFMERPLRISWLDYQANPPYLVDVPHPQRHRGTHFVSYSPYVRGLQSLQL